MVQSSFRTATVLPIREGKNVPMINEIIKRKFSALHPMSSPATAKIHAAPIATIKTRSVISTISPHQNTPVPKCENTRKQDHAKSPGTMQGSQTKGSQHITPPPSIERPVASKHQTPRRQMGYRRRKPCGLFVLNAMDRYQSCSERPTHTD